MMNRHKHSNYIFILALITCISCFSVSAQQSPSPEMFYGNWVFNETLSISRMQADLKQELQNSAELQQFVATFFSGKQMFFSPDGTFQITMVNGLQLQGQWILQGNQLVTQTNGAGQSTKTVIFSDNNNLCLIPEQYTNQDAKLLFKEAHYNKN
ncbi:hypothetical protein [uncultured Croceitalea sp.]|uniref:hypothetical protein n=1 Tax=uncultured Croceitalea sp. TaxID=1798908 RepID=UPI00330565DF